jgi:ligand-binding sensor domain-containing protein
LPSATPIASPAPAETASPLPLATVTASVTPAPPPTASRTPTRQFTPTRTPTARPTAFPTAGLRPTLAATPEGALPCAPNTGTAWRVWRTSREPAGITTLLTDGNTLWVGTWQGLARVDLRTNIAATYLRAQEMGQIKTLLALGEGRLWAHAESGCFYYDGRQWTPINVTACKYAYAWGIGRDGDLRATGALSVRFYEPYYAHFDGHIPPAGGTWEPVNKTGDSWMQSDDCVSLHSYSGTGVIFRSPSECQALNRARQILLGKTPNWYGLLAIDADGSAWYSYQNALGHLLLDGSSTTIDLGRRINVLAPDPQRGVWIGTGDGLMVYDGKNLQTMPLGLGACAVPEVTHGLAVDSNGVAWLGTTGGVLALRPDSMTWRPATTLGVPGEQVNRPIAALAADALGRVWATDNYWLWQFGGQTTALPISWSYSCYMENLVVDAAGDVWGAAAACGILQFVPSSGRWVAHTIERGRQGTLVKGVDGTLYTLGSRGLYAYSSTSAEWRLAAALKANAIAADRQGGLWLGDTEQGNLWRYRNGQVEPHGQPFTAYSLERLFVDSRNRLWAAGGLRWYDGQTWRPVTLPLGAIRETTDGLAGRTWVAGASGVAVYDPAADRLP